MKEGLNQEFYDNGKTKEEFLVINNVKEGYHRKWNDKGDLIYECKYVDGKKVGEISIGDKVNFTQYVNTKDASVELRRILRSKL